MDPAAVERFIRGTLGCGCPDEVFCDLRAEGGDGLHDGAVHVGGRLLVLLLRGEAMRERLVPLVAAGRQRRDGGGYNRVRVVVMTDDGPTATEARRLFEGIERDERTHLHVVSPATLAGTGIGS